MENRPTVYVFSCGSNMCARRMRSRVPTSMPVTTGYVRQHQLTFHKRSDDGSAKADAAFTGVPADRIWGVVYRLFREMKPVLDRHEFLGVGYDEKEVNVVLRDGSLQAWMYVARHDAIDHSLLPYSWYHDYIIQGAREHRLPKSYIDHLRGWETLTDPDSARHERNRRLIDT
jgi:gamma-glutamylcyclotransferase